MQAGKGVATGVEEEEFLFLEQEGAVETEEAVERGGGGCVQVLGSCFI